MGDLVEHFSQASSIYNNILAISGIAAWAGNGTGAEVMYAPVLTNTLSQKVHLKS
jgi:hypothetical protein